MTSDILTSLSHWAHSIQDGSVRNLAYSCAKLGRVVWFYSRMNCNVSVSDQERSGCKFQVSFFFFFFKSRLCCPAHVHIGFYVKIWWRTWKPVEGWKSLYFVKISLFFLLALSKHSWKILRISLYHDNTTILKRCHQFANILIVNNSSHFLVFG